MTSEKQQQETEEEGGGGTPVVNKQESAKQEIEGDSPRKRRTKSVVITGDDSPQSTPTGKSRDDDVPFSSPRGGGGKDGGNSPSVPAAEVVVVGTPTASSSSPQLGPAGQRLKKVGSGVIRRKSSLNALTGGGGGGTFFAHSLPPVSDNTVSGSPYYVTTFETKEASVSPKEAANVTTEFVRHCKMLYDKRYRDLKQQSGSGGGGGAAASAGATAASAAADLVPTDADQQQKLKQDTGGGRESSSTPTKVTIHTAQSGSTPQRPSTPTDGGTPRSTTTTTTQRQQGEEEEDPADVMLNLFSINGDLQDLLDEPLEKQLLASYWDRRKDAVRSFVQRIFANSVSAAGGHLNFHDTVSVGSFKRTNHGGSYVSEKKGLFLHVWQSSAQARRFVAGCTHVHQCVFDHRISMIRSPITLLFSYRTSIVTVTAMVPISDVKPIDLSLSSRSPMLFHFATMLRHALQLPMGAELPLYRAADGRFYVFDPLKILPHTFDAPQGDASTIVRPEAAKTIMPHPKLTSKLAVHGNTSAQHKEVVKNVIVSKLVPIGAANLVEEVRQQMITAAFTRAQQATEAAKAATTSEATPSSTDPASPPATESVVAVGSPTKSVGAPTTTAAGGGFDVSVAMKTKLLSNVLHRTGVNMRFLFLVFEQLVLLMDQCGSEEDEKKDNDQTGGALPYVVPSKKDAISVAQNLVTSEMVVRTILHVIRSDLATARGEDAITSLEKSNRVLSSCLSSKKTNLWEKQILPVLRKKYSTPRDFSVPLAPSLIRLAAHRLNAQHGLIYDPKESRITQFKAIVKSVAFFGIPDAARETLTDKVQKQQEQDRAAMAADNSDVTAATTPPPKRPNPNLQRRSTLAALKMETSLIGGPDVMVGAIGGGEDGATLMMSPTVNAFMNAAAGAQEGTENNYFTEECNESSEDVVRASLELHRPTGMMTEGTGESSSSPDTAARIEDVVNFHSYCILVSGMTEHKELQRYHCKELYEALQQYCSQKGSSTVIPLFAGSTAVLYDCANGGRSYVANSHLSSLRNVCDTTLDYWYLGDRLKIVGEVTTAPTTLVESFRMGRRAVWVDPTLQPSYFSFLMDAASSLGVLEWSKELKELLSLAVKYCVNNDERRKRVVIVLRKVTSALVVSEDVDGSTNLKDVAVSSLVLHQRVFGSDAAQTGVALGHMVDIVCHAYLNSITQQEKHELKKLHTMCVAMGSKTESELFDLLRSEAFLRSLGRSIGTMMNQRERTAAERAMHYALAFSDGCELQTEVAASQAALQAQAYALITRFIRRRKERQKIGTMMLTPEQLILKETSHRQGLELVWFDSYKKLHSVFLFSWQLHKRKALMRVELVVRGRLYDIVWRERYEARRRTRINEKFTENVLREQNPLKYARESAARWEREEAQTRRDRQKMDLEAHFELVSKALAAPAEFLANPEFDYLQSSAPPLPQAVSSPAAHTVMTRGKSSSQFQAVGSSSLMVNRRGSMAGNNNYNVQGVTRNIEDSLPLSNADDIPTMMSLMNSGYYTSASSPSANHRLPQQQQQKSSRDTVQDRFSAVFRKMKVRFEQQEAVHRNEVREQQRVAFRSIATSYGDKMRELQNNDMQFSIEKRLRQVELEKQQREARLKKEREERKLSKFHDKEIREVCRKERDGRDDILHQEKVVLRDLLKRNHFAKLDEIRRAQLVAARQQQQTNRKEETLSGQVEEEAEEHERKRQRNQATMRERHAVTEHEERIRKDIRKAEWDTRRANWRMFSQELGELRSAALNMRSQEHQKRLEEERAAKEQKMKETRAATALRQEIRRLKIEEGIVRNEVIEKERQARHQQKIIVFGEGSNVVVLHSSYREQSVVRRSNATSHYNNTSSTEGSSPRGGVGSTTEPPLWLKAMLKLELAMRNDLTTREARSLTSLRQWFAVTAVDIQKKLLDRADLAHQSLVRLRRGVRFEEEQGRGHIERQEVTKFVSTRRLFKASLPMTAPASLLSSHSQQQQQQSMMMTAPSGEMMTPTMAKWYRMLGNKEEKGRAQVLLEESHGRKRLLLALSTSSPSTTNIRAMGGSSSHRNSNHRPHHRSHQSTTFSDGHHRLAILRAQRELEQVMADIEEKKKQKRIREDYQQAGHNQPSEEEGMADDEQQQQLEENSTIRKVPEYNNEKKGQGQVDDNPSSSSSPRRSKSSVRIKELTERKKQEADVVRQQQSLNNSSGGGTSSTPGGTTAAVLSLSQSATLSMSGSGSPTAAAAAAASLNNSAMITRHHIAKIIKDMEATREKVRNAEMTDRVTLDKLFKTKLLEVRRSDGVRNSLAKKRLLKAQYAAEREETDRVQREKQLALARRDMEESLEAREAAAAASTKKSPTDGTGGALLLQQSGGGGGPSSPTALRHRRMLEANRRSADEVRGHSSKQQALSSSPPPSSSTTKQQRRGSQPQPKQASSGIDVLMKARQTVSKLVDQERSHRMALQEDQFLSRRELLQKRTREEQQKATSASPGGVIKRAKSLSSLHQTSSASSSSVTKSNKSSSTNAGPSSIVLSSNHQDPVLKAVVEGEGTFREVTEGEELRERAALSSKIGAVLRSLRIATTVVISQQQQQDGSIRPPPPSSSLKNPQQQQPLKRGASVVNNNKLLEPITSSGSLKKKGGKQ